jgi:glycine oxidase
MEKKYDVIVVGGGINGCSAAFQLAKKGYKVAIIEMDRIASKSSGAAAGILGAQTELTNDSPLFDYACKSREMFPELISELESQTGIHINLMNEGLYKIAQTEDQVQELMMQAELQKISGEQAEWIEIEELREREPAVSKKLFGAMFIKRDGQVQAYELTTAFARAAMNQSADIFEYTSVQDWIFKDSKILGVRTNQGDFYGDSFVVTTGAWSRALLSKAGLEVPVYPVKGECISVFSPVPLIKGTIFSHGCYIVPKSAGKLLIGATVRANTFDERVTFDGIHQLLDKAKKLIPEITHTEWVGAWAGIRPCSEDGMPFLGEHPEHPNLWIATGHYRNGILLAPLTGKIISEAIDGKSIRLGGVDPFGLHRLKDSVHG